MVLEIYYNLPLLKCHLLSSCFHHTRDNAMKHLSAFCRYLDESSVSLAGTWALEIFSTIPSLGCLSALFIVLSVANGKAIMVWHSITLNTIASILTTASKLSALFVISSCMGQTKWNKSSKGRSLCSISKLSTLIVEVHQVV